MLLFRCSVLGKELLKRPVGLLECMAQHVHLLAAELESRGGIGKAAVLHIDFALGRPLHRSMQDDEGVAVLALKLQQKRTRSNDTHGGEIHRNPVAALRAAHLLVDSLEDLLEGVRIKLHRWKYSTECRGKIYTTAGKSVERNTEYLASYASHTFHAIFSVQSELVMPDATLHPLRRSAEHAFVALAVFMGVTALSQGPFRATILEWQTRDTQEIAIEHTENAALSLDVGERSGAGILEFRNEGEGAVMLSLPESWKRREVRGARIDDVERSATGLGFVRYSIPPGATVSFLAPEIPAHLVAHHPSALPLKIRLSRVDLGQNSVAHDTVLLQGEKHELW